MGALLTTNHHSALLWLRSSYIPNKFGDTLHMSTRTAQWKASPQQASHVHFSNKGYITCYTYSKEGLQTRQGSTVQADKRERRTYNSWKSLCAPPPPFTLLYEHSVGETQTQRYKLQACTGKQAFPAKPLPAFVTVALSTTSCNFSYRLKCMCVLCRTNTEDCRLFHAATHTHKHHCQLPFGCAKTQRVFLWTSAGYAATRHLSSALPAFCQQGTIRPRSPHTHMPPLLLCHIYGS